MHFHAADAQRIGQILPWPHPKPSSEIEKQCTRTLDMGSPPLDHPVGTTQEYRFRAIRQANNFPASPGSRQILQRSSCIDDSERAARVAARGPATIVLMNLPGGEK
jgi:hypothetical protein